MITRRPPAGARCARPDHGPDQYRASRPGLLRCALGTPLWNPLWCPTPSRTEKAQFTTQIRLLAASSLPSSLLMNSKEMSVEEEIIGSGPRTPSAAGGGRCCPGPGLRPYGVKEPCPAGRDASTRALSLSRPTCRTHAGGSTGGRGWLPSGPR